jgi:ABC-2 type transport system ATP-binding protein
VIVEMRDVAVAFKRGLLRKPFQALNALSLDVREGDFFALVGRNGAGKSTAMYCLLGLIRPASGVVSVLGDTPRPGAPLFSNVGYLPEEPMYHPYLTVEEALRYYARLQGRSVSEAEIATILETVALTEHRRLRIAQASKGMKQKVGIAQCLVHRPRLLLLDEPMRGLDPVTVHRFREILVQLNREGTTIVMNSHLLAEVQQVANRVAIIERGRVLVQDELRNLVRRSNDHYEVDVENAPAALPFLAETRRSGTNVGGVVAASSFYEFIAACASRNVRVVQCALRTTTLEQSFLAALDGQDVGHA